MTVSGGFGSEYKEIEKGVVIAHQYRGVKLGVDASAWIHRFMYRHTAEYLVDGEVWQIATMYQREVMRSRKCGVDIFSVFDGCSSRNKAEEDARRTAARRQAMEQFESTGHKEWLQKALGITWALKRAIIDKLCEVSAGYIVAPYEADPQLAFLSRIGDIHGVVGSDGDFLCMGVDRLIKNYSAHKGTATEVSLQRITNRCTGPLMQLAHKHGAAPTFQAFSNLVGNDYIQHGALGKGKGGKAAIKLISERGVGAELLVDFTEGVHAQYERGMAAYNHSLVYNPETRALQTLSSVPFGDIADHLWTVLGDYNWPSDELEAHVRGIRAPDGTNASLPGMHANIHLLTPETYLTPSMVEGAILPDNPDIGAIRRWFATRGQPYPKKKEWARRSDDALKADALAVVRRLEVKEVRQVQDGQRVYVRDPDGKELHNHQDAIEVLLDPNKDLSIGLPKDRAPITDMAEINDQFPFFASHIMDDHFEDKALAAGSWKARIGGFRRVCNRSTFKSTKFWPPIADHPNDAYISMIVPPSMLDADKNPYEAWAALNVIASIDSSGPGVVFGVKRAGCSDTRCKAARGGICIHVGAMFWRFICIERPEGHKYESSSTTRLCAWSRQREGPSYNFLEELHKIPFTQDDPDKLEKTERSSRSATTLRRYNPVPDDISISDRMDPRRVAAREKLYTILRGAYGEPCLAELQWCTINHAQ